MPASSDPLRVEVPAGHMWAGQATHLLLLAALAPGAWAMAAGALEGGTLLGLSDRCWLALALGTAIVHQVVVTLLWRAQLCYGLLTRSLGDVGFVVWGAIFMPLFLARPLAVLGLGLADHASLPLAPALALPLGLLLLVPVVWTVYSIKRYFGVARALGGDHFFERYRAMPMVREGVFAHNSNAMYSFAFLLLWSIALLTRSRAALIAALFQHAYIWVHWYCTEQPDGVVLYGRSPGDPEPDHPE